MTTFIGIDFEYANKHKGSICAYGLAFENGEQEHGFVQLHPETPLQMSTRWHGISQEQTDGGMHFQELYRRLARLPQEVVLVAHDLKSDRRALLAAQALFGLPKLPLTWLDSLPLARLELGQRRDGGGIKTMAARYGLTINHHNPADDAFVALEVVKRSKSPHFNFVQDN